jgi:hypothetical protein
LQGVLEQKGEILETNEIDGFGYCDFHEEPVDKGTYEYKGCWGFCHFHEGKDFPYMSVVEASKELGVQRAQLKGGPKREN